MTIAIIPIGNDFQSLELELSSSNKNAIYFSI